MYISGASIVPQHKQMTRPTSKQFSAIDTGKDNETASSSVTTNNDLNVDINLQTNTVGELPPVEDETGRIRTDNAQTIQSNLHSLDVTLGGQNDSRLGGQENMLKQSSDLTEIQRTDVDQDLDVPEFASIQNNRYAVLDIEEESDDDDPESGNDGHGNKTKRRKYEDSLEEEVI